MVQKPARPGNDASGSRTRTGTGMSWDSGQRTVPWGAQCPRVSISAGRQGPGKLRDPGAVGSGARGAGDGPHHTRMAALAQGSSKDSPLLCTCGPWAGAGQVFRGREDTQLVVTTLSPGAKRLWRRGRNCPGSTHWTASSSTYVEGNQPIRPLVSPFHQPWSPPTRL